MIANECIDEHCKQKRNGILCKLDLEKAYDHVIWDFLNYILERFGFSGKWRSWMKGRFVLD